MDTSLPEMFRPRGARYRKVQLGIDFPSSFYDDLKSVDEDLWLVWHRFAVNYEGIILNDYSGPSDNPRIKIDVVAGELCFGEPRIDMMTREPIEENRWHIWRLNRHAGWSHVAPVEDDNPEYLNGLVYRLYLQDQVHAKSRTGYKEYRKLQEEARERAREKAQQEESDRMTAWQTENKELLDKAKDNLTRGKVDVTNPKHESIMSYTGQKHRSTLKRPLDDSDVLRGPGGEKY